MDFMKEHNLLDLAFSRASLAIYFSIRITAFGTSNQSPTPPTTTTDEIPCLS